VLRSYPDITGMLWDNCIHLLLIHAITHMYLHSFLKFS
jgi:hypothetical protein